MRTIAAQRRLPPRARSAGRNAARSRSINLRSERPARAHVWGKQAERSEAVGGIPTPFDLPATITTGTSPGRLTQFDYTADQQRVVRRDPDRTRHFVGDFYERVLSPSGATQEEHFRLSAGGMVAEIIRTPGGDQTLYFHPDALGTPETLTDASGNVTHQAFNPFGTRRDGPAGPATRVGYTGHHQDDDLGLIDMGGRVYDPLAARFTTADPIMQAPYWSQGQNRYAYVFNDPINMTDPSGFITTGTTGGDVATGTVFGGGGGILGYGIATEIGNAGIGSISMPAASSLGAAGGLGGGAANALGTLLSNPFQGSSGGTLSVAAPSGTPNANPVKPGGTNAVGQGSPPRVVQEKADLIKQRLDDMQDESLAMRGARRPRGAPVPGGGGPVLRPIPRQPPIQVVLPRLAPGRSFATHPEFVRWAGPAGPGMSWHHIVEQSTVGRFGASRVHTTGNYVRLDNDVHSRITNIYNKPWPEMTGSTTMTVRQWLRPQSYENHQVFGNFILREIAGL